MKLDLSGKIALVTGASRGIGKACAIALAQSGAVVAATATTEAGADSISQYFAEKKLEGHGFVLNVNQDASINDCLKMIQEKWQQAPLILVNNAAITADNLFMRMRDEQWHDVIQTNLTAIFKMTKACIKAMVKARWGRIISISSVVAAMGNPGQANYAAAKAGLLGFSKSLAKELASRHITCNVISPGFIETDMTASLPEEQKKAYLENVPMKRFGTPQCIADSCVFLASEASSYITGNNLHINGGMYMAG